jgi:hypothetical protein
MDSFTVAPRAVQHSNSPVYSSGGVILQRSISVRLYCRKQMLELCSNHFLQAGGRGAPPLSGFGFEWVGLSLHAFSGVWAILRILLFFRESPIHRGSWRFQGI